MPELAASAPNAARARVAVDRTITVKIISGGQTGVDRGALDAALELGIPCGGWCPSARLAEDGRIPDRYPVVELPDSGYPERTARNVADSDGTLIITHDRPIGGTFETVQRCIEMDKPHLVIDCAIGSTSDAIEQAVKFTQSLSGRTEARNRANEPDPDEGWSGTSECLGPGTPTVLNVAGPRASQWSEGYIVARKIVSALLRRLSGHGCSGEYSA